MKNANQIAISALMMCLMGCQNSTPTTDLPATEAASPRHGGGGGRLLGTVYGRSDSCSSGTEVLVVSRNMDCENLPNGNDIAWSIKTQGQCDNIQDTTVSVACRRLQSAGGKWVVYGRSDSCEAGTEEVLVTSRTQCHRLSNGSKIAWSIKVNGQCRNINDTDVQTACTQTLSELANIGGEDDDERCP